MRQVLLLFSICASAACASAEMKTADAPEAPRPTATSSKTEDVQAPTAPSTETAGAEQVPTDCARQEGPLCLPSNAFVGRLCSSPHPEVALSMFGKGTPWTRGYLRRSTEAWDAVRGGRESQQMKLGEEILVLGKRGPAPGMSVGVGGSYDVLRWDGACVSLQEDEVSLHKPPQASHANIPWKRLDERVRAALAADRGVEQSSVEFRKECKSAGWGATSPPCAKADDRLSLAVVEYVRRGGPIPSPDPLR